METVGVGEGLDDEDGVTDKETDGVDERDMVDVMDSVADDDGEVLGDKEFVGVVDSVADDDGDVLGEEDMEVDAVTETVGVLEAELS